ncbi:MAG TPA: maleylpyruvate isomerase family mycothiol-dependent enzyme [Amycolatopsis sp.]|nr:maleylpyruvate isomerase family mycothiol-dependent enzyme [Amycolatopsis sp.]
MATRDPWPVIHSERGALADDLSDLTAAQWQTESLCQGWSVHDVLGHLTSTAKMTLPQFLLRLAGSGFRFNSMADKNIARETAGGPDATLAEFRRVRSSTSAPPGPVDTWLGEAIVHAEDIRRPLGIRHTYPAESMQQAADFYKGSNLLIGAKNRIAGLRLHASDTDWTTGSGPEVTGPMLSLLLAMTGRTAAIDDLTGEGTASLRSRR